MPAEVSPTTTSTASSKPVDDRHPQPPSSAARQSAPSDPHSSAGALLSTTALFLWSAYLVIVIALPEADLLRKESTTPVTVLAGTWLIALIAWALKARVRPSSSAATSLTHFLPWINATGAWFIVWQLTTSKLGLLTPPYFAAPEVLIASFLGDWRLLLGCLGASALLFIIGYTAGSVLGSSRACSWGGRGAPTTGSIRSSRPSARFPRPRCFRWRCCCFRRRTPRRPSSSASAPGSPWRP